MQSPRIVKERNEIDIGDQLIDELGCPVAVISKETVEAEFVLKYIFQLVNIFSMLQKVQNCTCMLTIVHHESMMKEQIVRLSCGYKMIQSGKR